MPDSKPGELTAKSGGGADLPGRQLSIAALADLLEFLRGDRSPVVPGRSRALPPESELRSPAFVDLSGMSAVLEHSVADQVVSVEAGLAVGELDRHLARHGQWWPVDVAHPQITVGEVIASGEGGLLEHGFGGPRDLVLGLGAALASGEAITCGGRVMKNVSGYDLTRVFVGSRGWLGLITSANLRLYARPQASSVLVWLAENAGQAFFACRSLLRTGLPLSGLEVVDGGRFARLCPDASGSGGHKTGAVIVCRLDGVKGAVAEMGDTLSAAASTLPLSRLSLSDDADPLSRLMAGQAEEATIDISCTAQEARRIIDDWAPGNGADEWQARPARGRLKIVFRRGQAIAPLVDSLRAWLAGCRLRVSAAYADTRFEYRVQDLPAGDPVVSALKLALKSRFDPLSRMNPLVSL